MFRNPGIQSLSFTFMIMAISCILAIIPHRAHAQDGYLINVGDVLEIDILDDSDIAQRFLVGNNGSIQLPFVGSLVVKDLSIEDARALVKEVFVDRQIFVDPTVELSIAAYRPVFVLGDVQSPGYFDFQLFLSPEKALGLAGGPTAPVANIEARILERRSLEGAQTSIEMDLAGTAVEYARVQAQLRGEDAISQDDILAEVRRFMSEADFVALSRNEDAIINLELASHITQKGLLLETIAEAEIEIDLLRAREGAQLLSVERARTDLARALDLEERGVQTASALSEWHRRADIAEDELLQLRAQQSMANRRYSDLMRDLSLLEGDRQQRFLASSQDAFVRLAKLQAERSSIIDRLELLQQWSESWASTDLEARIEYRIRRRTGDGLETMVVEATDELLPGDLLIVTLAAPEIHSELVQ